MKNNINLLDDGEFDLEDIDEPVINEEIQPQNIKPEKIVRQRILHTLSIYPKISLSMLQVGIGTSIPPALWKPVYELMVESGELLVAQKIYETPTGRNQTYTTIEMAPLKAE